MIDKDNYAGYFKWLVGQAFEIPCKYVTLCHMLFKKDFYYILDMDENRATDGVNLRSLYLKLYNRDEEDVPDRYEPCSMLEMMIALSQRISDLTYDWTFGDSQGDVKRWFKILIENLNLDFLKDQNWTPDGITYFHTVIDKLLDRRYDSNGIGSLFPIQNSELDMRTLDIWYQMNRYLKGLS